MKACSGRRALVVGSEFAEKSMDRKVKPDYKTVKKNTKEKRSLRSER